MKTLFLVAALFIYVLRFDAYAEELIFGFTNWQPWQIRQVKDEPLHPPGILIELTTEMTHRAGIASRFIYVSQKRRDDVEWGKMFNAEPGTEPSWRKKYNDVSVYTDVLLHTRNVVIARKGKFLKTFNIAFFFGKTIGTNKNYYYADGFSKAFVENKIVREDVRQGDLIFNKLRFRRNDFIIADQFEWKYWAINLGDDPANFEEIYQFKTRNALKTRLHISKKHLIPRLNQALHSMHKDGTVNSIIEKYTVK